FWRGCLDQIISQCPMCYGKLRINLGQTIYNGKVNYYEEHFCIDCGYALEIDGYETPFNSRMIILEKQGTWKIVCLEKSNELFKNRASEVLGFDFHIYI
uniref:hypothetical protein n=1 Tax=Clostridium botulinum TaxID=1491 RepID=UPI001A9A256E